MSNTVKEYSQEDLQFILDNNDLSYLNLDWELIKRLKRSNDHPLKNRTDRPDIDVLRVMRDPKNFHFTCKYILNKDILPFQNLILQELWHRPFPMLVGSRGISKTFTLGLYCTLRALINQGCNIIITGAAFRQAKVVFEYIEKLWESAPVLRNICGTDRRQGWHHDSDRWWFGIGESTVSALPIGDGQKIRGFRANYLISDEFACVSRNTLIETNKGLIRIGDFEDGISDIKLFNENGNFEEPSKFIRTPYTDVYKVTTKWGYSFECSSIHQTKTTNGYKLAKDLTDKDYLVFKNDYKFPNSYVKVDDILVDENLAWIMGILTAEGGITSRSCMSVIMTDKNCIDRLEEAWHKLNKNIYVGRYEREEYIDSRGWDCKRGYLANVTNAELRNKLVKCGLKRDTAHNKTIPWSILQSPESVVIAYLSGLFEGDGSCFLWKDRGKGGEILNRLAVAYYSVSEQLCSEVQILLKKLNIFSAKQPRESNISDNLQWMLRLNGGYAKELCEILNINKWKNNYENSHEYKNIDNSNLGVFYHRKSKKWCTGITWEGKNKYLGLYKTKNEALEAVAKFKKENGESLKVRSVEKLQNQQILYDFYMPETHSFYGGGFIQHNSQNPEIYENVIAGFAFVSSNPVEKVKENASIETLKSLKLWTPQHDERMQANYKGNQSILAGTAYYSWNHFYQYYKRYKAIIESRGDEKKLEEIFQGPPPDGFDWRDFSLIQLPLELAPKGLMDEKQIVRSKVTTHTSVYQMEFGAVFAHDSDGFFKRSLIESCVTKDGGIQKKNGPVQFKATTVGLPNARYVYGIDPASESDKFTIVVLELHEDHSRIVYCWATDKEDHRNKLKLGIVRENDFYGYVNRKVRSLMRIFPCVHIAMDSQGGGHSVMEAFRNKDSLEPGEVPLLLITPDNPLSDKKERECDGEEGLHIVELCTFGKADWVSGANHNLKMDFEQKNILFPYYDPMSATIASEEDERAGRNYDTLEDCVMEIEELKDELATIVVTATPTGREHFDTPETKISGSKKGRMRKDRYSALLMANAAARVLNVYVGRPAYMPVGGFVGDVKKPSSDRLYNGPAWFTTKLGGGAYGNSIVR